MGCLCSSPNPFQPMLTGISSLFCTAQRSNHACCGTSAISSARGLILEADGGTLFLDEVDSLPLSAQVKLLRFLQDREFRPLGSHKTFKADLRIIAAANVDLEEASRAGRFRQDLYYRLNVVTISLPPLRLRQGDV